jgi:DNA-binding XRE family transcriptional regulator
MASALFGDPETFRGAIVIVNAERVGPETWLKLLQVSSWIMCRRSARPFHARKGKSEKSVAGTRTILRRTTTRRVVGKAFKRPDARDRVPAWDVLEEKLRERMARNVRRIRVAEGFTQEQAAKRCGMTTRTWQRIEAGMKGPTSPKLLTVARVAVALGVDPHEIFRR